MDPAHLPPAWIFVSSNSQLKYELYPDSDPDKWQNDPATDPNPVITITLPEAATVVEVSLHETENIASFTVEIHTPHPFGTSNVSVLLWHYSIFNLVSISKMRFNCSYLCAQ